MEPRIENNEAYTERAIGTINRLASEKSPYLLQHATNPVDWFPWGDEAFEKARKEDKPIFLSIGYSTCHWCHVMEHESFEDDQVAALLNKSFVSIKVDREERPDIDHIYMTVCQLLTGSGGWPLTIIMTPDKEPFFAATYIPKTAHFSRPGMLSLIPAVADAWKNKRAQLLESSSKIVKALEDLSKVSSSDEPGEKALHLGFSQLAERFDHDFGGFGKGMKFPTPHQLVFLLRYWNKTGQEGALEMAEKTLTAMRKGGIFDHVGFGFHRYSTDRHWLVPHFEKMLYDQALLLYAYTEAFQATKNPFYKKTALQIGEYVLRDMTSPEGGFYSAEDADSEGEEGKFYFFTASKIRDLLDKKTADLALLWFGVQSAGNFEDEASGRLTGQNILHEGLTLDSIASKTNLELPEIQALLENARKTLFEAREKRTRPLLDDKILTDWNGLMIGALAVAGRVLGEPEFLNAAKNGVQFIRENLTDGEGHLLHRYRDGEAGPKGYLDDYAFYVFGLIELFESTYDPEYLEEAIHLNDTMIDLFQDQTGGGFYLSARDAEKVLVRPKELYDGAIPSGNSVAFHNLARLSRITGNPAINDMAVSTARSFHRDALTQPSSHSFFLSALDFALGPSVEIVIAGDPDSDDTRALLKALDEDYSPNRVVVVRSEKNIKKLVSLAPYTASQVMLDRKATAYVCVRQSCSFPTTDLKTMLGHVHTKLEQERGNR